MCLLSAVEQDFDPIAQALGTSSHMSVVTPQDAKEVFKLRMNNGKMSRMERAELLPSMRKMCAGIPILKVEEVTVSKSEYMNGKIDRMNSTSTNVRKKRQFSIIQCATEDICSDAPVNGGRYCRWYSCNSRDVGGNCDLTHIRSGDWQCTVCCPTRSEGNMCKCDEVRDKQSFIRCQNKNKN